MSLFNKNMTIIHPRSSISEKKLYILRGSDLHRCLEILLWYCVQFVCMTHCFLFCLAIPIYHCNLTECKQVCTYANLILNNNISVFMYYHPNHQPCVKSSPNTAYMRTQFLVPYIQFEIHT